MRGVLMVEAMSVERFGRGGTLERKSLRQVRCVCLGCGSHVIAQAASATLGGSCGNCGSYELSPVPVSATPSSSQAPPPLSRESAIVLGLAATVLPLSHTEEDQADCWLRLLRRQGQVGAALRALGVPERPLGTAEPPAPDQPPSRQDALRLVEERAVELACLRGQGTVGTGELLFAVLEVYGGEFTRLLYASGVTLDQLLEQLAQGSGSVVEP
jgi:hypothetical protein